MATPNPPLPGFINSSDTAVSSAAPFGSRSPGNGVPRGILKPTSSHEIESLPLKPLQAALTPDSAPRQPNSNFVYKFTLRGPDRHCSQTAMGEYKEINEFLTAIQGWVEASKDKDIKASKLVCTLSIRHLSFSEVAVGSEEMLKVIARFKAYASEARQESFSMPTAGSSNRSLVGTGLVEIRPSNLLTSGAAVVVDKGGPKASEVEACKAKKSRWLCC
jgi:hypothetical protein